MLLLTTIVMKTDLLAGCFDVCLNRFLMRHRRIWGAFFALHFVAKPTVVQKGVKETYLVSRRSFNSLPTLKKGAFLGLTSTSIPVLGLRAV